MSINPHQVVSRFSDGRLDPFDNTTHLVFPGADQTLCAELVGGEWEPLAPAIPGISAFVNCQQCGVHRYWLPADRASGFERGTILDEVIEPWPLGERRNVTGDDDPARGRYARPENLQLCLTCVDLRGPFDSFDNLCRCDRNGWVGNPKPRYGDLSHDAHLCKSCLSTVVPSGSRWSAFYCGDCRLAVRLLGQRAGRFVVPFGPHSLMNGTYWRSQDGAPMTNAQATAFHDQLTTLFADQDTLQQLTTTRTEARVRSLGLTGHAVAASDYTAACRAAGITARVGFIEFITAVGHDLGPDDLDALWQDAHTPAPGAAR